MSDIKDENYIDPEDAHNYEGVDEEAMLDALSYDPEEDMGADHIRQAMLPDEDMSSDSGYTDDMFLSDTVIDEDTAIDEDADTQHDSNEPSGEMVSIPKNQLDLMMTLLRSLVESVEVIETRLDNHRDTINTSRTQIESLDGTLRILFEHIEKSIR